jgi:ParB-like chromosome segregation protein Spo0J
MTQYNQGKYEKRLQIEKLEEASMSRANEVKTMTEENLDMFDAPADPLAMLIDEIASMQLDDAVERINQVRFAIHNASPFKNEPIDFVRWVRAEEVQANDYNPNSVAPPEMALLEHSIEHDGYTQPVVGWPVEAGYEVVDGFHRTKVAKTSEAVRARLSGYLPIVSIQNKNTERNDRVAATIRHNRARGEHKVESMSDIVVELKRRFWSDEKISKELGMEPDEVLRLAQVTGLAGLFADQEFSEAWEAETFEEVEGVDELDN